MITFAKMKLLALGALLAVSACTKKDEEASKMARQGLEAAEAKSIAMNCDFRLDDVKVNVDKIGGVVIGGRNLFGAMHVMFDAGPFPSAEELAKHEGVQKLNERSAALAEQCGKIRGWFEAQLGHASEAMNGLGPAGAAVEKIIGGDESRWAGVRCEDLVTVTDHAKFDAAIDAMDAWETEWQERLVAARKACAPPAP